MVEEVESLNVSDRDLVHYARLPVGAFVFVKGEGDEERVRILQGLWREYLFETVDDVAGYGRHIAGVLGKGAVRQ